MAETVCWKPPKFRAHRLTVFNRQGYQREYELEGRKSLGRFTACPQPDIVLSSGIVSRSHGEFGVLEGRCFYRDTGSKNGTWIRGRKYGAKSGTCELADGDVLAFCPGTEGYQPPEEILLFTTGDLKPREWTAFPISGQVAGVTVGRQAGDLPLGEETASEKHAVFFQGKKGWYILDCKSKNGVYLNGQKVDGDAGLAPLDVVRIGDTWFVFTEEAIWVGKKALPDSIPSRKQRLAPGGDGPGGCLTVAIEERNVWQRFKKKTLLKDINLTIACGDMVLVLGGSGAGKTTFMNAVMGYEKAEGSVVYGGRDVYEEYRQMKYEIGFVPQQDLLRDTDTVYETLKNAARLRMPSTASKETRLLRVEEVMGLLGLKPERGSLVSKLSGGQRKRLSIAVEFISGPQLFFLDEPDSGLDGVMARGLMENLRQIADTGKIVMVITHGPDRAADLFHKVVVLAKSTKDQSGHLAFFGTVEQAYGFFGTDSLEGVVRRINRTDEGGEGKADQYIEKYRIQNQ